MNIAVLSGKGGAGKTFVSVNLSSVVNNSTYIDCDVEEPNGRLFFKPENIVKQSVYTLHPKFDYEKCIGCRSCVSFCKFNALVFIKNKPKVFKDICHSCGGCQIVCPQNAISEEKMEVGHIETGKHNSTTVITGELNLGVPSGVSLIKQTLDYGMNKSDFTVIDCPPGSACSVMESANNADFCLIVVEPTEFGFHNFKMVFELAKLLNKQVGVVINKMYDKFEPLENFCNENDIPIFARIKYDENVAKLTADGMIACEFDENIQKTFKSIVEQMRGAIK